MQTILDWEDYRCEDGTLDLIAAFAEYCPPVFAADNAREKSLHYLREVQSLMPINSRQVASLALASAYFIWLEN